jgi:hypothetical protein
LLKSDLSNQIQNATLLQNQTSIPQPNQKMERDGGSANGLANGVSKRNKLAESFDTSDTNSLYAGTLKGYLMKNKLQPRFDQNTNQNKQNQLFNTLNVDKS